MKKVILFFALIAVSSLVHAQEHQWAFGFYGDINVKTPKANSFGVQAKYDLDKHSSLQAQVHGRTSFVAIGADYLFSFLNKEKSNFNVFMGAGIAEEFVSYQTAEATTIKVRDEMFVLNGQAGVSYYFAPVKLSVFSGYKVKYYTADEKLQPNYLTLGVRYHLW